MFIQNLMRELLQLLSFMKSKKRAYILGLVGDGIGQAAVLISLPFVFKDLTDFANTKDPALLTRAIATMALMFLLLSIFSPFFSYIYRRCVRELIANIRLHVYQRLSKLPFDYYEQHHSGDTMSRLGNDVVLMENAYAEQLKTLSIILLSLIGSIIGMFAMDWKIAVVLLLVSALTLYVNTLFAKSVRRIGDRMQKQMGMGTERLNDFLSGLPIIKMFHLHNVVTARYMEANEEVASSAIKQGHKHGLLEGTNFFIQFLSFGGMLVFGIMMVSKQMIGLGVLVALVQQQMLVTLAFLQLGQVITALQSSLAGASRVVDFLNEPLEPEEYQKSSDKYQPCESMLKLEQVVFGYTEATNVLDGVSLRVEQGQMAGLVGTSGSGKSTVMKLLLGYYPPASGSLYLLGKPMGAYSLAEIRSLISYVPQDAFLFEGTIEDNIRYGCLDASEEDVIKASKAAYAHDFIMELSDGYQTKTGERGAKLSGGQRQRIAIARAILKNAPILLLDEATSALDAESEYWVQQALTALMKDKTVLVIAHRLSTVEYADVIYVMDQGKVIEQGRHVELMEQNGTYAKLYEVQQRKDRAEQVSGLELTERRVSAT
ncbi:ABC transporter ATP-binding protein [Brevibacillus porteri]|uniref:ABC transporter ATP-binding protein n=1 Tax=Brevibacillus porteri TaxID=2126350 RepID=A0ABX5FUN7_9BACL|nr:ABC transporter ATP-binding protein [Brevibacillus porteri]MED1799202.1 ABC transporter ATP-binding protein [Brevibacillus porteri]MED2132410.1 ABC transporter ATP-binding protein [Brevibacillus porteri]MED2744493.1 ABC transporter ATP-binding protein [Brevibacillus porteri]MED2814937.1 ABC transporter ATP-binding protein [Brevibacillus porteri]MED2895617.1 ABC transporter ATP-binding protein [Brevibacillus porteri]